MVAVGGLGLEPALAAIDLHVLVLLVGVLVIAAYLQESRFFRWAAYQVLTRARSARSLLVGLTLVAAALSALLVNDTVCLVLTPLVVAVTVEAGLPVLPYLLALATAANLGGVVTFSGNPQNMLIGHAAGGHPGFAAYLALTLPVGLACVAVNAGLLLWMFRRELPRGSLAERRPPRPALDRPLTAKALLALAGFAIMALAGVLAAWLTAVLPIDVWQATIWLQDSLFAAGLAGLLAAQAGVALGHGDTEGSPTAYAPSQSRPPRVWPW